MVATANTSAGRAGDGPAETLDDIRRQIDAIDQAMHDLLMQRTELVREVAAAKAREGSGITPENGIPAMRPGREAQVLRGLAERHRGGLPVGVILRIWREIVSAKVALQGDFRVVVAGRDLVGLWDVARTHYGSNTPAAVAGSVREAFEAAAGEPGVLAIVSVDESGADEGWCWWRAVFEAGGQGPRIAARLPFLRGLEAPEVDAFALGRVAPEPSGDDRTVAICHIGRADADHVLHKAGVEGEVLALNGEGEARLALIDVPGFLIPGADAAAGADGDNPLHRLGAVCGHAPVIAGTYATPLTLSDA